MTNKSAENSTGKKESWLLRRRVYRFAGLFTRLTKRFSIFLFPPIFSASDAPAYVQSIASGVKGCCWSAAAAAVTEDWAVFRGEVLIKWEWRGGQWNGRQKEPTWEGYRGRLRSWLWELVQKRWPVCLIIPPSTTPTPSFVLSDRALLVSLFLPSAIICPR